jgi:hypothetical protein
MHAQAPLTYARLIKDAGWSYPMVLWRWHVWTVFGAYATEVE